MSKRLQYLLANAAVLLALTAGCRTSPSPGIEFGNPNLDGKSIRVVPAGLEETYEISLLDEENAAVDQRTTEEVPALLDMVVVPYTLEGNLLRLEATFTNARHIVVSANVPEATGDIDGTLTVDGKETEACFEIPGVSPSCETEEGEVVLEVEADEAPPRPSGLPKLNFDIPVTPHHRHEEPGPGSGDAPPYSGNDSVAVGSPPSNCKDGKCWILHYDDIVTDFIKPPASGRPARKIFSKD